MTGLSRPVASSVNDRLTPAARLVEATHATATRKAERAKLTEIAAKGYPIDFAAFDFTASPVTTYGVDVSPFNAVAEQ